MTQRSSDPRPVIRPLTADDVDASVDLAIEAFGELPAGTARPTREGFPESGRHPWGTFVDGRLVARMLRREYHSWWHGQEVPTSGIAGVAVMAEARGSGLLRDLFRAVLGYFTERGDVISTLFPTAPGIYRPSGYETVCSLDHVEIPTRELMDVRPPAGVRTRRATVEDMPAVRRTYDAWAALQNGPLTRSGPSFPATDEDLSAFTGITLAVDEDDAVVGYCRWNRGRGFGDDARIQVPDLVATTADGYRALWRLLGSFASVAAQVRVVTSGADTARLVLPTASWRVIETHPYMLRLLDVPAAFTALPSRGPHAVVPFRVTGDVVGATDGDYRLILGGDRTVCERADGDDAEDVPTFTPGGLALLWSGVQTCANIRAAGLLHGGTPAGDALLDDACAGRPLHVRDHF